MGKREVDAFPRGTRLNQIQVIGTHNSYHLEPEAKLLEVLIQRAPETELLRYSHTPLGEQLGKEQVRQLELDVYADPEGGLFQERAGLALIGQDTQAKEPELAEPGFKVMHVPHIDYRTHCLTLRSGLTTIKNWSHANPGHIPLMILIEVKGALPPIMAELDCSQPVICGKDELAALEQEILAVIPRERLIMPDDIRGRFNTLEEGVLKNGWPLLADAAGKILFALDNTDRIRDLYLEEHPSLEGRVMFTSSLPGTPSAGFIKANNPEGENGLQIQKWVKQGYLVRTMSDPRLNEISADNLMRVQEAFNSGAHFVSTDFPRPHPSGFVVRLPGAEKEPARINPCSG